MARPSLFAPLLVLGLAGCALPDRDATLAVEGPDRAAFTAVSPFLENGCGTLDCHGARPRPLRVYGFNGLRLDPGDRPGDRPTTPAEVDATWTSVCGLQPEATVSVLHGAAAPDALMLVQKARAGESHKGGAVVQAGDDGDRCMTSWLAGDVDPDACARAAAAQRP